MKISQPKQRPRGSDFTCTFIKAAKTDEMPFEGPLIKVLLPA